jgi:DNA-directed RNA polymerase specialized sigma24 family protein
MLTDRKVIDGFRRARARPAAGAGSRADAAAPEPTPAFAAELAEEFARRLRQLRDDELRTVALLRMEGLTNQEIATRLERSPATVERKLALIRKTWEVECDGR